MEEKKAISEQQMSFAVVDFLEIKEIKDSVVILKNGSMRAVLMTSSINFDLKSTAEQEAIIYRYQGVLNSFDFTTQILINSRRFNIDPYLAMLSRNQKEQTNELLRIQTSEYIDFIKSLTEMANIMTESFFVVIPYATAPIQQVGFFDKLLGKGNQNISAETIKRLEQNFEKYKSQLWQRVDFVASALQSIGVRSVPLNDTELLELFHKSYNLGSKNDQELNKAKELRLTN